MRQRLLADRHETDGEPRDSAALFEDGGLVIAYSRCAISDSRGCIFMDCGNGC